MEITEQQIQDAANFMKLHVSEINYRSLHARYRELSKSYHPDTGTSETMMYQLNLSNDLLREELNNGAHTLTVMQAAVRKEEQKVDHYIDAGFEPKTKPYQHQVDAFNRFKNSEYFALFMDMGTGKTKTIIDISAYKHINGKIEALMVIAPNHVHTQWVNEQFPQHCSIPYKPFIWEQRLFSQMTYKDKLASFIEDECAGLKVFAVNVEAFQAQTFLTFANAFLKMNKTMIVLDESTRIKNPEAKRAKKIVSFSEDAVCRAILTGTPTAKSPLDIYAPFNFLKDNYFNMNWRSFQARYSVLIKDRQSTRKRTINDYDFERVRSAVNNWQGRGDMFDCYSDVADSLGMSFRDVRYLYEHQKMSVYRDEEDLKEIIAGDTFSVRKEDCLDLPSKIYEAIEVDMSPEQRRAYDQLILFMKAEYEGAQLDVSGVLAMLTRFMQICGGHFPQKTFEDVTTILLPFKKQVKLQALLDDIEENCHDKQMIVWANFNSENKMITEALRKAGYSVDTYYGPDSATKRERTIEKFARGEIQILVASTVVAGYGLNLQFCSYQYFYSNNFRTEARIQAEDRSHRIGQQNTCVYKDIIIRKSIDQVVLKIIRAGKALNDYFKNIDLEDVLDGTFVDEEKKAKEEASTAYLE